MKNKTTFPFILITTLFFLWGFAHNLDPILIPHLKRSFNLTTMQATLVDSAVFIAYFVMAIPAGLLMKKFGYKTGIITGLLLFALGSFMFIPAANAQQYSYFLIALFIIACGLTILETAANPYATALGSPETGTQRLNFAQAFNGLATFLAPIVGARIILKKSDTVTQLDHMTAAAQKIALADDAATVKIPYAVLGCVLLFIAVLFSFTRLPKIQNSHTQVASKNILHALKHKHLAWAVTAQFFYVGAQVCVVSLFILYATRSAGITELEAAYYVSACGLAFVLGRFIGTFLMRYIPSARLLGIYAIINTLLCIAAMIAHGMSSVYVVIGVCFFMSIMFPTIFALGIKDLHGDTEFGSSLIIMAIVGGALLPRAFAYISDVSGNIQYGYVVPAVCFAVVGYFGFKGHRLKKLSAEELPVGSIY
jgi:FHS family L-fucose permease-like MFS transporter